MASPAPNPAEDAASDEQIEDLEAPETEAQEAKGGTRTGSTSWDGKDQSITGVVPPGG